jgi:cell division control protein 45
MVRITNNVYHEAYEYIKQDAIDGNCIVFVSADVDSICAIRIFQVSYLLAHNVIAIYLVYLLLLT